MTRIGRNKYFKMVIGFVMTIVLVLSLFAGIGAIWINEETHVASADTDMLNASNKYVVPAGKAGSVSDSTKGTETNPFTVLEIVPNHNMAQFGYLVGGQEPIDLLKFALSDDYDDYHEKLSEYMDITALSEEDAANVFEDHRVAGETYELKKGETTETLEYGDPKILWVEDTGSTTQYGQYEKYNGEDKSGTTALVEEKTELIVGWTVVKQETKDQEIPDRYVEDDPDLEEGDVLSTYDEAENIVINGLESTDYEQNDREYYVKVTPGTGLFSSYKYDYEGVFQGAYSLIHRKVEKENGEAGTLSLFDPTQKVYMPNYSILYDRNRGKYNLSNTITIGAANNNVWFRLKDNDGSDDDLPTYDVASTTGKGGETFGNASGLVPKYDCFNEQPATASDYDYARHDWDWRDVTKTEYNAITIPEYKKDRWAASTDEDEISSYPEEERQRTGTTITYEQYGRLTGTVFRGIEESEITKSQYDKLRANYRRMEPEESTVIDFDTWNRNRTDTEHYVRERGRQLTWTERKDWSTDLYDTVDIDTITSAQQYINYYDDPSDLYGFNYDDDLWTEIKKNQYNSLDGYNSKIRKTEDKYEKVGNRYRWVTHYYLRKAKVVTYYEFNFKHITKTAKYYELVYKQYTYKLHKYSIYKVVQEHYYKCDYVYSGNTTGDACVVFRYNSSGNGKYVVGGILDEAITDSTKYMSYDVDSENTVIKDVQWVSDANGHYDLVDTTKYLVPQYVGDYYRTIVTVRRVMLGEYNRDELTEKTIVEEKEKNGVKTVIGERDYDRYVIVPVYSKDATFTYRLRPYDTVAADISANENLTEIAVYKWVGEKYARKVEDTTASFIEEHTLPSYMQDGAPATLQKFVESSDVPTVPTVILSYTSSPQHYSSAYLSSFTSNDLFKKNAIGLAYKNNTISPSKEIESFTFLGWYTDKYGVNKFSNDTPITSATEIFAKWLGKYTGETSGYSVSFEANDSAEDRATNMPATITNISQNAKIIAPDAVPMRTGYTFDGWYTSKNVKFDFANTALTDAIMDTEDDGEGNSVPTKNLTLHAEWKAVGTKRYTFVFNANARTLPSSVTVQEWVNDDESGNHIYAAYGDHSIADIADNGFGSFEVDSVKPYAEGYTFDGWYMESECKNRFRFDSAGIAEILTEYPLTGESTTYTLYAKWIDNNRKPKYNITFNLNKPSGAVASPTFSSSVLNANGIKVNSSGKYVITDIEYGTKISDLDSVKPTLVGNVEAKLDNYKVKVVTVTPDELRDTSSESFKLISRADLIVLNETCDLPDEEHKISDLWNTYKKYPSLTAKKVDGEYVTSFAQNDLSWDAVLEILSRITGYKYVSGERTSIATCPVLFDYNIYYSCLADSGVSSNITLKTNGITITNEPSSKANIFKLYLMTQSASPITIYNAYISGQQTAISNEIKTNSDGKAILVKRGTTSTSPFDTDSSSNANLYWNRYTLVPFKSLSSDDWADDTKRDKALKMVGFVDKVSLNTIAGTSRINNRLFIYNNREDDNEKDINLISGFTETVAMEADSVSSVSKLINIPEGTDYKTSDIFYYMLHGTTQYDNLERDLRILEIEPGTEFHTDEYWFWYISHYVHNVTGTITGKGMSSLEFQCNIDDLNSEYDIIFMGTNKTRKTLDEANGTDTSSLAKIEPRTKSYVENEYTNIGNIKGELLRKIKEAIGTNHRKKYNELVQSRYTVGSTVYNWYAGEGKTFGEYWDSNITEYDKATVIIEKDNDTTDKYSYRYDSNYIYIRQCTQKSYRYWGTWYPATYVYMKFSYATYKEVAHDGDTFYTYYHTGNVGTTSQYAVGSFNSLTVNADGSVKPKEQNIGTATGVNDDLTVTAAFSGNDFTFSKYKAVAAFLKAQYPIIFDDGFFDADNKINTNLIDQATWIYTLLNELVTENPNRENYKWFRLNTVDDVGIEAFQSALMNKTFTLKVTKSPIEYTDKTKLSGSDEEKDKKVYINGVDPDNRDLEFEISIIENVAGGKYKLRLFIDTNADGKYSTETEFIDTVTVKEIDPEHSTIPFNADEGYLEGSKDGSKSYKITRTLPEDQVGIIAWKLQITEVKGGKETSVRDDVTRLSAIKAPERTKINVLQIVSTSDNTSSSFLYEKRDGSETTMSGKNRETTVYLPTDEELFENKMKLPEGQPNPGYLQKNWEAFRDYTKNLDEFEVHYFRITKADLKKHADPNNTYTFTGTAYEVKLEEKTDPVTHTTKYEYTFKTKKEGGKNVPISYTVKWDDIGMLVLGFGYGYNDIDDKNSRELIYDFIESGKTVLFTNDTIKDEFLSNEKTFKYVRNHEYYNYEEAGHERSLNSSYAGYNLTQSFRNLIGQDRFGAYENFGFFDIASKANNGDSLASSNVKSIMEQVDVSMFSNIDIESANDYDLDYDIPFVAGKEMNLSSISNLAYTYKEYVTGLQTFDSPREGATSSDEVEFSHETSDADKRVLVQGFSKNALKTGAFTSVFEATQTNEGQIVSYPYSIGEKAANGRNVKINTGLTRAQYMQLNMEDDDIVVWFSLYKKGTNSNNDVSGSIINDGTNNYYIYSKGNITYTGVGFNQGDIVTSAEGGRGGTLTEDEYKLFVNTMIAAYRSNVVATKPKILNSDKSSADDKDYLYVDFDATLDESSTEANPIGDDSDDIIRYDASGNIIKPGETTEVAYYAKRVKFTLVNDSIVMNKQMTIHYYPVIMHGNVKVTLYAYPIPLKTYWINPADGGEDMEIKEIENNTIESNYTYKVPDAKSKESLKEKVNTASIAVKSGAGKVTSSSKYYVDIPINTSYYEKLIKTGAAESAADYYLGDCSTYSYEMIGKTSTEEDPLEVSIKGDDGKILFGLGKNDRFEIEIQVVMRYGRNPDKNDPLVGTRGVVLMRRGMFKLD